MTPFAAAAPQIALSMNGKAGDGVSMSLQVVLLLTALTLLPAIIMSVTPFLRIIIVLHFLRQALGTQSTPSNQVLIGLALFLSLLLIQPVVGDVYAKAWEPLSKGEVGTADAWQAATPPSSHSC